MLKRVSSARALRLQQGAINDSQFNPTLSLQKRRVGETMTMKNVTMIVKEAMLTVLCQLFINQMLGAA